MDEMSGGRGGEIRGMFAVFEMRGTFGVYKGVSEWACGIERSGTEWNGVKELM